MFGGLCIFDDNLRRGLSSEAISDLYFKKPGEMVDHLFLDYEFSYALWCRFLGKCDTLWCFLGSLPIV